ncbi:hypothetical protein AN219_32555 [Streptomyces nanshensis]|nr:hypothetical protein AN219_32555 [Streptomyces nanshensis]
MAAEAAASAAVHGGGRDAAGHARRAAWLREMCGGFTAVWSAPAPRQEPLSERQREVGELAAQGLENAAIAARLSLAVRTVANHLQTVYAKLGVRSRTELAGVLGCVPEHRRDAGGGGGGGGADMTAPRRT